MYQSVIHVYFMPGMAAGPEIFERIKLPENQFQMHYLQWLLPLENESIESYALRLSESIKEDNAVLIGVSFGGVIAQEIGKQIALKKVIIISSIKSYHELPKHMRIAKITKAYKILPTHLLSKIDFLVKYAIGKNVKKKLELYRKYLSVNDNQYLNWAINNMVCWKQDLPDPNVVHIHGDKDPVFPIKYITNCITIKNGSHIMILNKYKWFNENLPSIILKK